MIENPYGGDYDALLTSWAECRALLSKERSRADKADRDNDNVERLALNTQEELRQFRDAAADQMLHMRRVIDFVDSWISNPASSYSTAALDGLFGLTRDKIAAVPKSEL